ncbi:SUKH-4 family immunity protein [Streptomyces sp. NPDC101152]|uniref:SUKH-4 family immunity protein n=1 Tax=Streptomyces sp. NPDC101152 TaxID=3366116 RepID=UPI0037F9DD33
MVTFAQAQERAEEWINGDVPSYQHREVRVREFELGFVVWAEDRAEGPRSDGGAQRLVIARDSGEATLWPALPVGEVIRRYEEEYGRPDVDEESAAPAGASARVDLNQTSFLLSPPEWLQEAADKLGIGERRDGALPETQPGAAMAASGAVDAPVAPDVPAGATPWAGTDTNADAGEDRSVPLPATVFAPPLNDVDDTPPDAETALISGGSRLPPTAVTPVPGDRGEQGDHAARGAGGGPGAPARPEVPGAPSYGYPQGAGVPGSAPPGVPAPGAVPPPPPGAPSYGYPQGPGGAPGVPQPPGRPGLAPNAGDIADAATSRAAPPSRRGSAPPPPPGAPGAPGARPGSPPPPPPGPGAGGYVPTQLVSALGPDGPVGAAGPQPPGAPQPPAPQPPGAPGASTPPGAPPFPGAPGTPTPPGPPVPPVAAHASAAPGAPQPPSAPGVPAAPGAARAGHGAVHHAETVLAPPPAGAPGAPPRSGPGVPPPPPAPGAMPPPGQPGPGVMPPPGHLVPGQQPPAYGYPPQPSGQPTVGPGYQAVLRYRAQDGSEQQVIRRSAPGTPHPEWQIFHELRGLNVPPDQVLELHTELESCELPGAYCARMIREQWPQARITSIAPYGTDHASRQQGMQQLLAHQGELHQVADGPARPAPVRAPLPPVQAAPPVPPEDVAQELAGAFGPGTFRFEQQAVSRQGVPPIVAQSLVVAGLPLDMGPFFWAQAQPGRPVPTLAELAQERGVRPAADAGSYLVMGSDFGKALCVQYGTANIVAVPVEAGPGGAPVPPQFVNSGLPEFQRCLALLGRMWRLRFGLNQEQAGRWTVDFQAQLASLDPAALGSPESWWSVLLEQMWDGLL